MRVPLYQIDAFSQRTLGGNPAAVCPLDAWLPDDVLLALAGENNLSETAFVVRREDGAWDLRWFTPTVEVDLCGHATLAAAFALRHRGDAASDVVFHTRSGVLTVRPDGERLQMDFPAVPVLGPLDDAVVAEILGHPRELWRVKEVHHGRYALAVLADEAAVRAIAPDTGALGALRTNVIVTAPGDEVDVVSRFFAPASGIAEDPVTGSAHATLGPFWAERLGRPALHCRQVSRRSGDVWTEVVGDRVRISGFAALYLEGWALVEG